MIEITLYQYQIFEKSPSLFVFTVKNDAFCSLVINKKI